MSLHLPTILSRIKNAGAFIYYFFRSQPSFIFPVASHSDMFVGLPTILRWNGLRVKRPKLRRPKAIGTQHLCWFVVHFRVTSQYLPVFVCACRLHFGFRYNPFDHIGEHSTLRAVRAASF